MRSGGFRSEDVLPATLLAVFGAVWTALAIAPLDRETWMLENVLLALFVGALVAGYRRFHFSRIAYVLMFVFLSLHAVGGHYTYSLVPYDDWAQALFGSTVNEHFGWTRNHYDRLLHFLFGLLLALPARELLVEITRMRVGWSYFLAVVLIMASSSLYELIEWAAAIVFGGELGMHYLGTQGDEWDGHRDMALAAIGAVLIMSLAAARSVAHRRMSPGGEGLR